MNASCQQKQTLQAIFPSTHGHSRTKVFQTSGGKETTLALRMTTKTQIKQTSFVALPLKYFENTLFFVETICDCGVVIRHIGYCITLIW